MGNCEFQLPSEFGEKVLGPVTEPPVLLHIGGLGMLSVCVAFLYPRFEVSSAPVVQENRVLAQLLLIGVVEVRWDSRVMYGFKTVNLRPSRVLLWPPLAVAVHTEAVA